MADDIVDIGLSVDSRDVKKGRSELDKLGKQGNKTKRATDGLTRSFKLMAVSVLSVGTAIQAFRKLIDITREFDKLNASLITSTGSAVNASIAFDKLQKFAAETPYDLQQVVKSFTKLKNYGLDPSEKALESYGNTSSALGKNLNDMVEAVADAATGEFERLKEFGIRASKEKDKVTFTFRGVKETVGLNSKEIEGYLIALGENNFGSAMADQMSTLNGALSNLGDEWDNFFRTLSQSGAGKLIEQGVRTAIELLDSWSFAISGDQRSQILWTNIIEQNRAAFAALGISIDSIDPTSLTEVNMALESMASKGIDLKNVDEDMAARQALYITFSERVDRARMSIDAMKKMGVTDPRAFAQSRETIENLSTAIDVLADSFVNEAIEANNAATTVDTEERFDKEAEWFKKMLAQYEGYRQKRIAAGEAADEKEREQLKRGEQAFAQYVSAAASSNKAFFEIQKIYQISKIAMEAKAAVADAFAWGNSWGGPKAGYIMAGIAGAAMATYAADVASASYGGKSSSGKSSSATVGAAPLPSVNDQQQQQSGPTFVFNNYGNQIGSESTDEWFSESIKRAADYDMFTVEVDGRRGRVF